MKKTLETKTAKVLSLDEGKKIFDNNLDQVHKLMDDKVYLSSLLWLPYKQTPSNLVKTMMSHHTVVSMNGANLSGLSFATPSYGNGVTLYDLFFYGESQEEMLRHIILQLDHLQSIMPDGQNAEVEFVVPLQIKASDIKQILEPFLGPSHLVVQTNDTVAEEVLVLKAPFHSKIGTSRL